LACASEYGEPANNGVEVFERKNQEVHTAELGGEGGVVWDGAVEGKEGIEQPGDPKGVEALRVNTVS
jgi:hypothetical protein